MKNGFVKVAAATPQIRVGDCNYNADNIIEILKKANDEKVNLIAFPELCVTGYTCGDLFFQSTLINGALNALKKIISFTENKNVITLVGTPFKVNSKLYNCAAVIYNGKLLALVPKSNLPNHNEFSESRHFSTPPKSNTTVEFDGETVLFGTNIIFKCKELNDFSFSAEICEDLWSLNPPSNSHAENGANIIVNLSASPAIIGKKTFKQDLVKVQSSRLICGYIIACAGEGESTTDLVFSGHNIICENGEILNESQLFSTGYIVSEIDIDKISIERSKYTTFPTAQSDNYAIVSFSMTIAENKLTRKISPTPFTPQNPEKLNLRCEEILNIQTQGLKKRLTHSKAKTATLGISGGLDSALSLLVCARAMDALNRPRTDIVAVTMPCFGTTKRTKSNAQILCERLGVTFKEVNITSSVTQHFKDIKQDENNHDVTFENAQARERTQVLMDIANQNGGIVVGTGDLSELALGWATYNGDHMSMYGTNAGVPKTLVRHLVNFEAQAAKDPELKTALLDILATPVSPELIPPKEGEISQKTEDIVGPYELHDFFLYYIVRHSFSPQKVFRLAKYAFDGTYDDETIKKWLKTFVWRFFSQQFKRSCLPDAPKIGSVSLSPRGDWQMPSDAVSTLWLDEINNL